MELLKQTLFDDDGLWWWSCRGSESDGAIETIAEGIAARDLLTVVEAVGAMELLKRLRYLGVV